MSNSEAPEQLRHQVIASQYDLCQRKMAEAVEQLARIETYALVAIGAIYAWLFAQDFEASPYIRLGFWTPFLLTAVLLLRILMQRAYMATLRRYLIELEEMHVGSHGLKGWEIFYRDNETKKLNTAYRTVYAVLLCMVTLFLAISVNFLVEYK